MRRAELEFGDDLRILFVDEQEPLNAVLGFADKYGLTSTFLMDRTGSVGFSYRLRSTPTTFFLDPSGVVQDIRIGVVSFSWLETNMERSLQ
ncbi:MAG: TlpA family protein disulfide reductase [Chloroflexi bacterium]|nr:TlpA family protein disulfide reductase [Chloroflexota bacterium]